ncbi:hypothetical protein CH253_08120 [Rhodococcus sp. 06-156-3C]|uniref:hypothetical protein n=1 Tax=Rhodococcus sp. 06-156-3C TaxID=2022486 RepID=UPI000B9A5B80|nr:hypothetical protein [Rhodococcus sp. 06-156-3C]OZD23818.1 hypothetical protein CH253_08120 [Rhodococcus sp. 06-156-3C]
MTQHDNKRKPATAVAVALLNARLPEGVRAYADVPRERPPSLFVTVKRVGGVRRNVVTDNPLYVVGCYAPGDMQAEALANDAIAVFENAPGVAVEYVDAYDVTQSAFVNRYDEAAGPQNYPDPDVSTHRRWQFSASLGIASNV